MRLFGCRIFDGTANGTIEHGCVEVAGKYIERVCQAPSDSEAPTDPDMIDARGLTALPGFTDCEGHLSLDGKAGCTQRLAAMSPTDALVEAIKNAERFLVKGVTTVRDLGDRGFETLRLRDAIKAGKLMGPRILAAGMPIRATGGHFVGKEVDGTAAVMKAVRENLHEGVDVLKLISTSSHVVKGSNEYGTPELTCEEMRAAVQIAANAGVKSAAHNHCSEGVSNSVRAGVDSVEHGTVLSDEIISMMLDRGTWLVPTFVAYDIMAKDGEAGGLPRSVVNNAQLVLDLKYPWFEKAVRRGVRIALGTDAGSPLGAHGNIARELRLMMEGGMSVEQALASCTSGAAELLGIADEVGTLRPGLLADIVLVRGNPLESIMAIEDVAMVFQAGQLVVRDGKLLH